MSSTVVVLSDLLTERSLTSNPQHPHSRTNSDAPRIRHHKPRNNLQRSLQTHSPTFRNHDHKSKLCHPLAPHKRQLPSSHLSTTAQYGIRYSSRKIWKSRRFPYHKPLVKAGVQWRVAMSWSRGEQRWRGRRNYDHEVTCTSIGRRRGVQGVRFALNWRDWKTCDICKLYELWSATFVDAFGSTSDCLD